MNNHRQIYHTDKIKTPVMVSASQQAILTLAALWRILGRFNQLYIAFTLQHLPDQASWGKLVKMTIHTRTWSKVAGYATAPEVEGACKKTELLSL